MFVLDGNSNSPSVNVKSFKEVTEAFGIHFSVDPSLFTIKLNTPEVSPYKA